MAANVVGGVKTKFHPSKDFATFTSQNLRPDLLLMDIDLVVRDRTGNMMLLEIKARGKIINPQQRATLSILHAALSLLNNKVVKLFLSKCMYVENTLKYWGCHLLQFEKGEADFSGKVWLDGKEVTKEDVIAFLNFQSDITK